MGLEIYHLYLPPPRVTIIICNSAEAPSVDNETSTESCDAVLIGRPLLSRTLRVVHAFYHMLPQEICLGKAVGTKGRQWDLSRFEMLQSS